MANDIVNYQNVTNDIKGIISSGREVAYNAANKAMVLTTGILVSVLWSMNRRRKRKSKIWLGFN